jgi:hypothetical protein
MLTTSMISKSVKPDLRDVFIFSFCFITPVDSSEFLTPTIQGDAGKQAGESPGFCAASRLALKFWITSFGLYLHLIQGIQLTKLPTPPCWRSTLFCLMPDHDGNSE